jgi:hypothetical protein
MFLVSCSAAPGLRPVLVRAERPDLAAAGGPAPVAIGHAFPVGDGVLLTCAHLFEPGRVREVGADVALVRNRSVRGGVAWAPGPLGAGDRVSILDARTSPPRARRATAVGVDLLEPEGEDRAPFGPGLSGAPVVDGEGRVCGMVYGVLETGDRVLVGIRTAAELRVAVEKGSGTFSAAEKVPDPFSAR